MMMRVLAWNWDPTHEKSLKRYLRRPPKANHKNSRLDAKEVCSYVFEKSKSPNKKLSTDLTAIEGQNNL